MRLISAFEGGSRWWVPSPALSWIRIGLASHCAKKSLRSVARIHVRPPRARASMRGEERVARWGVQARVGEEFLHLVDHQREPGLRALWRRQAGGRSRRLRRPARRRRIRGGGRVAFRVPPRGRPRRPAATRLPRAARPRPGFGADGPPGRQPRPSPRVIVLTGQFGQTDAGFRVGPRWQQRFGQSARKGRRAPRRAAAMARRHSPMPSMTPGWIRSGRTPARASELLPPPLMPVTITNAHPAAARRRSASSTSAAARARPAKRSRCSKSNRSNPRKGLPRVQLGAGGLFLAQAAHDHRAQVALEILLELARALEGVERAGERAFLRVAEEFRVEERLHAPPFLQGLEVFGLVGDAGLGRLGGLAIDQHVRAHGPGSARRALMASRNSKIVPVGASSSPAALKRLCSR